GGRRIGMCGIMRGERLRDGFEPVLQPLGLARVEGGHRADDPGLALGNHQIGIGNDEQRRANHGHAQSAGKLLWQGHGTLLSARESHGAGGSSMAAAHDAPSHYHFIYHYAVRKPTIAAAKGWAMEQA